MGLYNYTNLKEMYDLYKQQRVAFIITDIQCKDIDEYINNCIITLQNSGVNTNLMVKPKIYKSSNKYLNVVLSFNHKVQSLDLYQKAAFMTWINEMGNVESLKEYMIFNNKLKSENIEYSDILNIYKNKYNLYINFIGSSNNEYTSKIKFIYTGDRITSIEIKFKNKNKSYKQSVDSMKHGFYDILTIICKRMNKENNIKPTYVLIDSGNSLNKLDISNEHGIVDLYKTCIM